MREIVRTQNLAFIGRRPAKTLEKSKRLLLLPADLEPLNQTPLCLHPQNGLLGDPGRLAVTMKYFEFEENRCRQ